MTAAMATMTSKHQITIPKELREDLKMKAGDKLVFIKKGDTWELAVKAATGMELLKYLGRGLENSGIDLHKEWEEAWDDPERP